MENKRQKVMLVDDNITNLTVGKNALQDKYDVFTIPSGEKLLKILERSVPDLILLDIDMPEMTGYDVIKILKETENTAKIPVIFLTAKTDPEDEIKGLSLGAIDYIIKPFSPPLLQKRIEMHLLVEQQAKQLQDYNDNLQEMVAAKTKTVFELQNAILQTVAELVECRDDITGGHIERTQSFLKIMLNKLIAEGAFKDIISTWELEFLVQSAQLHDVGKISIKDSVLGKPGRLTPEEFEEMKKHTVFGESIIEKIEKNTTEQTFLTHAKIFAGTHHEKWDGTGYPKGLKGESIPLQGRIMAIADVYDALISERPYKRAFTHDEAVKIICEGSGTQFDPILVGYFIEVADEFNEVARKYRENN
ncbi:MAG: response regulator [Clostridiales bacterium]|jgi:putative two-component system response regulator|nr:response regulator [Clostridiales bacterium]